MPMEDAVTFAERAEGDHAQDVLVSVAASKSDAGAIDESEKQPPGDASVAGLREEIRAQLAAHLVGIRNDVQQFLRDEVAPLRGALAEITRVAAPAPAGAAPAAAPLPVGPAPEGYEDRVAAIEARLAGIDAKIKHWV